MGVGIQSPAHAELWLICSAPQESAFHDTEYDAQRALVVRRLPNIAQLFHAKHKRRSPPPPPPPSTLHHPPPTHVSDIFRGNGRQGHHCFTVWLTMKPLCIDCSIIQICPKRRFYTCINTSDLRSSPCSKRKKNVSSFFSFFPERQDWQ